MKDVDKRAGAVSLVDELKSQGCEISESDLTLDAQGDLGVGGSGTVTRGLWLGTTEVAVKILHGADNDCDSEAMNDMYIEMGVLSKLRHPNIVSFFGYSHYNKSLCLVTEYVAGGDLNKYIYDGSVSFPQEKRIAIAKSICAGMVYLHSQNVMHRDLKPGNILVTNWDAGTVKICDFGLSRALKKGKLLADGVFSTPAYSAPELSFSKHTKAVDVYSFAIILWEMAARKQAWDGFKSMLELAVAVENGERPKMPPCESSEGWYNDIVVKCWNQDPIERPTFREIFDMFREHQLR